MQTSIVVTNLEHIQILSLADYEQLMEKVGGEDNYQYGIKTNENTVLMTKTLYQELCTTADVNAELVS